MYQRTVCAPGAWLALVAALVSVAALARASDHVKGVRAFDPEHKTVDLFDGMASGELDVQLIAKDASRCRLLVTNRTPKPLNVRVPEVLGAAPVLAQAPVAPPGGQNPSNSAVPQSLGLSMPGVPGAGPNAGANRGLWNVPNAGRNPQAAPLGGLFNLAPEAVGQFRLPSVCLEHGKPNPRPGIFYRLVALERLAPRPELAEVLRMLGRREVDQKIAQAAAWRLNNGMSWTEVAAVRIHHLVGPDEPFFTPAQIASAKRAVERAATLVAEREEKKETAPSRSVGLR
jgi:hypothetical protein